MLFALASAPAALARSLLDDVVTGDTRLAWRGASVGLAAPPGEGVPLEHAHFVVVDLETTGLSPRTSRRAAGPGARARGRVRDARRPTRPAASSGHLADGNPAGSAPRRATGRARDPAAARLHRRCGRCRAQRALRPRLPRPRGRAAHRTAHRLARRRHRLARAAPPGGAHAPCRARLAGALLRRPDGAVSPCVARRPRDGRDPRRARGARPGTRRTHARGRRRARCAARSPAARQALPRRRRAEAAGGLRLPRRRRARPLRRSRPRPTHETTVVLRWRSPAALRRGGAGRARAGRVAGDGLRARGGARGAAAAARAPSSRQRARHAARPARLPPPPGRPLDGDGGAHRTRPAPGQAARSRRPAGARRPPVRRRRGLAAALPGLRERRRRLGRELRFEDAARLRDRLAGLEEALDALRELERLRALSACIVVPARQPGFVRAHAIAGGRVAAVRRGPRGPGAAHEVAALVAEARRVEVSIAPEDADELRLVASFLRRPPPELRVTALDPSSICATVDGIPLAA